MRSKNERGTESAYQKLDNRCDGIDCLAGGVWLQPREQLIAEGYAVGACRPETYFGTYSVSGSELGVGDVAVTEMWCMEPEGVMDQEQAFLDALASVASYRLAGDRLELLDETGEAILIFEPQAEN
jgi:hypothetical protein